jgi:PIN domain nuclease of toxin-antitoxin system
MLLLLDTHAFLWFVWGDPQLSPSARALIEDDANRKFVSMVSIWEMAIKVGIGKLTLARPFEDFLADRLDGNGFEILPIDRMHVARIASLPLHHRDPFDRLLASQSVTETMSLLSADPIFDAYGVSRLW